MTLFGEWLHFPVQMGIVSLKKKILNLILVGAI